MRVDTNYPLRRPKLTDKQQMERAMRILRGQRAGAPRPDAGQGCGSWVHAMQAQWRNGRNVRI